MKIYGVFVNKIVLRLNLFVDDKMLIKISHKNSVQRCFNNTLWQVVK